MIMRNEPHSDIEVISQVARASFQTLPISNHAEPFKVQMGGDGAIAFKKVMEL